MKGHKASINSVAFSMDGSMIASGSWDKTIGIWDSKNGRNLKYLEGHDGDVWAVTFSINRLISCSNDRTIRLWDPIAGKPDGPPIDVNQLVWSVAASPDGAKIAGACQIGDIKIYDAATRQLLFRCVGHRGSVQSVDFSPDGRLIASVSYDCTVRIWDSATGAALGAPLVGHEKLLKSVAFSPDSRFIASGSDDQTVRIWDVETGRMRGDPLSGHTQRITGAIFIPGSSKLASSAHDRTIKIWDLSALFDLQDKRIELIPPNREEFHGENTNEIVRELSLRGCPDLTNELDLGTCGDYPISSGGFGDIYRCKLSNNTEVAIKTIRFTIDSSNQNHKVLKHSARELYTWSRCRHPNVQHLLGLAIFRNTLAMVTLWELNGNLSQYLLRNSQADKCAISAQVADGLAYLHTCKVIHGDLKCANILVSRKGVPQLADFGNAILQDSTLRFSVTSTAVSISPRWAAPELFTGGRWSAPSDVYALGMTILEIITGEVPWSGKIDHAVMFSVLLQKACPERPLKHIPEDSKHGEALWWLLGQCWEFEPEKRPTAEMVKIAMKSITQEGLMPGSV